MRSPATRLSYGVALAIGLSTAWLMFPRALVAGALPDVDGTLTDFLQHATGQIAFFHARWHWPLLVVHRLDAPVGTNIALTDSIPLQAVLLKLWNGLARAVPGLPDWQQGINLAQAFNWTMQPVAAVFALRSFGERRLLPAVAVAVFAIAMPTWLIRMWHTALDSHYLLLIGLGLYARCTRVGSAADARPPTDRERARPAVFALLMNLTFLIHPYLMVMVEALLCAVPLTLLLRRGAWRNRAAILAAAAAAAAAAVGVAAVGALLGYWKSTGDAGGFGLFSMNLASPFWPHGSALFPHADPGAADGTGGQAYEGNQYLGAGLFALLAVAIALPGPRRVLLRHAGRHVGLVVVAVVLTLFAISDQVWLFHRHLFRIHTLYPGRHALRSSGRLFWDVTYLLLVGAVFAVARGAGRAAPAILLAAASLQYVDAAPGRIDDHANLRGMLGHPSATGTRLAAILPRYRLLSVVPRLECDSRAIDAAMRLVYLAVRADLETDTMYTARSDPRSACMSPAYRRFDPTAASWRPDPRTLVAAVGDDRARAGAWLESEGLRCGVLGPYVLCAPGGAGLGGLPYPAVPTLPAGAALPAAKGGPGAALLFAGWSAPESWGTWSDGPVARLLLPPGSAGMRLTLRMHAAALPGGAPIAVVVTGPGGDPRLADWSVSPGADADYRATLPNVAASDGGPIAIWLALSRTLERQDDRRRLGLALISIRLDPSPVP